MQTFETARLLMRPLHPDDEDFYCRCYTDKVLMEHIGEPLTPEAALRSFTAALKKASTVQGRSYTWAMQEKASGTAVGLLAMFCDQAKPEPVNAELGTIMLAEFQNKGFTAEALRKLADFAFNMTPLQALLVKHKSQNTAVTGVMAKLGYLVDIARPEGTASCQWILSRDHWQTFSAVATPT